MPNEPPPIGGSPAPAPPGPQPTDLDASRVRAAAGPWGLQTRWFDQIPSTNTEAAGWAPSVAAPGGLVVAGHQTAGRGRRERAWFSAPGAGLLFSLALRPELDPDRLGLVPLAAGVAVCTAARAEGVAAALKWPNDLIVAGRKAGGILCESAATVASRVAWVVVGVGLNVNLPRSALPPELQASATSLAAEAGRPLDRGRLLESFLACFLPLLARLEASQPSAVLDAYRPLCETVGRSVRAMTAAGGLEARATGIDTMGRLVLDTGDVLDSGEVVHVGRAEG